MVLVHNSNSSAKVNANTTPVALITNATLMAASAHLW